MCLLCTSRRAIFNLSDPFQAPGLLITGSTRQRAHASTLFNVCNYVLGMLLFCFVFCFCFIGNVMMLSLLYHPPKVNTSISDVSLPWRRMQIGVFRGARLAKL